MFRIGQRVVCVDDSAPANMLIVKGHIYTISGFDRRISPGDDDKGVYLVEVKAVETTERYDSFYASRFRPVVERETDISIFKAMLTGTKVPEQQR